MSSAPSLSFPLHQPGSVDNNDDTNRYFYHQSTSYNLNSRIMLTAIVSLSVVVALVVILHIYARCVLRRQARRRSALLSMTLSQVHSSQQPKTGLDQSVIDSFPTFNFRKTDADEEAATTECAVCLSVLEEEEVARLLPNCRHTFHAECIDKWLSSHSTCPICRTEAEPRLLPVSREPMVVISRLPSTSASASAPPPVDGYNSTSSLTEGTTSEGAAQCSGKGGGASTSRLSSFRRMLSMGSSRRTQSCGAPSEDDIEDRC